MKKLIFLFLVLLLCLGFIGCNGIIPSLNVLSAEFTITEWEQSYYQYSGEWSKYVYVYYKIENTGNVEIDYYKVYFEATCADGSKFEEWTNGMFIDVGHTQNDYTLILVLGKEVVSIEILGYELDNWGQY